MAEQHSRVLFNGRERVVTNPRALDPSLMPAIIGIGAGYGSESMSNSAIAKILVDQSGKFADDPEAKAKFIEKRTSAIGKMLEGPGIQSRYWAGEGQATSHLTEEALKQAIEMAGINKEDLRGVITGTGSADYIAVSVGAILQQRMGLPHVGQYADVDAACVGWAHALKGTMTDISSPYGVGGPQAAGGAEVLSRSINPNTPAVYTIFGDAAGVTVVDLVKPDDQAPQLLAFNFGADGAYAENLYVKAGGSAHPTSHEDIDTGANKLHMDGFVIKDQAIRRMSEAAGDLMRQVGLDPKDVALFIPHQANLGDIMVPTAEALNIPLERTQISIADMGNTSAATIPTAMRRAWDEGKLNRNDIVLMATFGAGLNWAAVLCSMVGLPKR